MARHYEVISGISPTKLLNETIMNAMKASGLILGPMTTVGLITYGITGMVSTSMIAAGATGVISVLVVFYLGLTGRL